MIVLCIQKHRQRLLLVVRQVLIERRAQPRHQYHFALRLPQQRAGRAESTELRDQLMLVDGKDNHIFGYHFLVALIASLMSASISLRFESMSAR